MTDTKPSPYAVRDDARGHGLAVPGSDVERNGYNDSDFFITCWNPETGEFEKWMYGTTRCAAPDQWPRNGYLTGEHPEWGRALAVARQVIAARRLARIVSGSATVAEGVRVRVVKPITRKTKNQCAEGAVGTVGWMREEKSRHGTWSRGWRVGVDLEGETVERNGRTVPRRVFLDADRVAPVDAIESVDAIPDADRAEIVEWAETLPADRVWTQLVSGGNG